MKKFIGISAALFVLFACAISADAGIRGDKETEANEKVISVHQINLKQGVSSEEFERFIMKELMPLYNKVEGQNFRLAKGDRGLRDGKYAILLIFDSVKDRDRIYPPEGGISEDFEKILEGKDELWDKLGSFVEGDPFGNHTDYVTVVSKD